MPYIDWLARSSYVGPLTVSSKCVRDLLASKLQNSRAFNVFFSIPLPELLSFLSNLLLIFRSDYRVLRNKLLLDSEKCPYSIDILCLYRQLLTVNAGHGVDWY